MKLIMLELESTDPYKESLEEDDLKFVDENHFTDEHRIKIINHLLNYMRYDDKELNKIFNERGYFTTNQIKEEKGIEFTNKDKVYFRDSYNLNEINIEKPSSYEIERMVAAKHENLCFVAITPPQIIKDAVAKYKKSLSDKRKKSEEKKKAKEIEKAKKLLESVKA